LLQVVGLVVVLALVGRWAWQRWFVTDETRIRRQIGLMERAVEQGSLLRLEGAIAQDYSDDVGLDKASLLGAVRAFRQQYGTIFIHLSDLTVTVAEDRQTAEAVFIAKVLAQPAGSVTSTEVRQERLRLYFRQRDRGWLLYRTESPQLRFD
ncbi:hypothetical protein HQ590_08585, partial [bacterium]|nr:hypothetical protein [bacterium]